LGNFLRQRYINASSPYAIQNISQTVVDLTQIQVRADAGGEGGVILNSAAALLQGLYPSTLSYNETLANGTVAVGASNGYQVCHQNFWMILIFIFLFTDSSSRVSNCAISQVFYFKNSN